MAHVMGPLVSGVCAFEDRPGYVATVSTTGTSTQ
jgi:hypothetical protein